MNDNQSRRRAGDMKGPKSMVDWAMVYVRRVRDDENFSILPNEEIVFYPEHGFFTYVLDLEKRCLIIPKMCGHGRFLRHEIYRMVQALGHLGFNHIRCFSRRPPEIYLRVLGGRLDKMEIRGGRPLYHYIVTVDDTKDGDVL